MKEMVQYLRKNAWVQAMDFVALYSTSSEERYERNWSAILKSPESVNNSSIAKYVPYNQSYEKKCFSKDLDYSGIKPLGTDWRVFCKHDFTKYAQQFNDELNDFVIMAYVVNYGNKTLTSVFAPNLLYEVVENYADFDLQIANDAEAYPEEYASNHEKILNISKFPAVLPTDREEQLKLCADRSIPVLTIQGPPGTGKTSFLSDLVERLLNEGVPPGDIHCLTYTKRASTEIRRKLKEKVKAKHISASALPDLDIEGPWTLEECAGKIYCENIFKNPPTSKNTLGKARQNKRPIILIDEASQISIPYLLYGLRYGTKDAIVRLFGDQRQLDSVCTYVRDYKKLGAEKNIRERLGDGFNAVEAKMVSAMACASGNIFDEKNIKDAQFSNMLEKWARSYFSISDFFTEMEIVSPITEMLKKINLVRNKNYRQELELHNKTHELSYEEITAHESAHDQLAANVEELIRHKDNTESRSNVAQHLFADAAIANKLWGRVFGYLEALAGVARRFLGHIFGHKKNEVFTQADHDNVRMPKPFSAMGEVVFKAKVKEFFSNTRIASEMVNIGAPMPSSGSIATKLWDGATKHHVVISHDFPQDKRSNENRWEAVLACLFIYLWEHDPIRTSSGTGAVTPYRNQEVRIKNLYLSAFPDSKLRKDPAWCATPERFQGSDLSRCVFSTASEQENTYLEPSTMFSKNKLNVATSRASHQQIVVAHKDLLSEIKLQEYINKVEGTQNKLEKRILKIYPLAYRKGLVKYCSGDKIVLNMIP